MGRLYELRDVEAYDELRGNVDDRLLLFLVTMLFRFSFVALIAARSASRQLDGAPDSASIAACVTTCL